MKKSTKLIGGLLIALAVVAVTIAAAWPLYRAVEHINTRTPEGKPISVYLSDTSDFQDLLDQLNAQQVLIRERDFLKVARLMQYGPSVKPGHYLIRDAMSNRDLLIPLRSGHQDPIRLTFSKFRDTDRLAGKIAQKLMLDSASLSNLLRNPDSLSHYGLEPDNVLGAFLPNTYEFWWTSTEQDFMKRMLKERQSFWAKDNRLEKANELGLNTDQITALASIVEEEQNALPDEWPRIAGLYLNRIHRGMPLAADPTIKFAMRRFDLQRVYLTYIEETADSPFNTYKHIGIPPGPICTASTRAIDAVLNPEEHSYLFMCAKADFSGYHAFAETHAGHIRNRNLYTAELDRRGIR